MRKKTSPSFLSQKGRDIPFFLFDAENIRWIWYFIVPASDFMLDANTLQFGYNGDDEAYFAQGDAERAASWAQKVQQLKR